METSAVAFILSPATIVRCCVGLAYAGIHLGKEMPYGIVCILTLPHRYPRIFDTPPLSYEQNFWQVSILHQGLSVRGQCLLASWAPLDLGRRLVRFPGDQHRDPWGLWYLAVSAEVLRSSRPRSGTDPR